MLAFFKNKQKNIYTYPKFCQYSTFGSTLQGDKILSDTDNKQTVVVML